jgi:hypothetical protein
MIVNKYKYGGSGSGSTSYSAGEYISLENDVISVTGITPDLYLTTADTQDFVTEADITAATSPIQTQLDDIERVTATALTELHNDILEISGSTPDLSNYYTKAETNAAITGATQGLATEAYVEDAIQEAMTGFTPELPSYLDQEVLEAKEEVIASALTHLQNEILDISGDTPDLSNYYTKAETNAAITGATQGFATQAYVTGITSSLDTRLGTVEAYIPDDDDPDLQDYFVYTKSGLIGVGVNVDPVNYVVKCTQSDYDILEANGLIDSNTFYIIVETQG